MTEQEKRKQVIKGMESLHERLLDAAKRNSIAMLDAIIVSNALALLKAQEPVGPVFDAGDGKTIGQFLCGKCHAKIGFGHPHFCWYCGRPVKWE